MTDQLLQEVRDLEAAAAAADARYEFIDDLAYPPGVQMAVNFTADFDAMLLRRLLGEPPMQLSQGEFGGRVGIWRLIELFNSHDIKATVFTPGRICELYPKAVAAAAARHSSFSSLAVGRLRPVSAVSAVSEKAWGHYAKAEVWGGGWWEEAAWRAGR